MEAVILCGVQGAGKSTFCHERYRDTHIRINYDMLRTRHREQLLLMACLAARQPLVVDATNPTPAERARYLVPCRQAGFRIVGIEFQVEISLALARNAQRTGKACVPEQAILATAKKFVPLQLDEGFDEIWQLTLNASGRAQLVRQANAPASAAQMAERQATAR